MLRKVASPKPPDSPQTAKTSPKQTPNTNLDSRPPLPGAPRNTTRPKTALKCAQNEQKRPENRILLRENRSGRGEGVSIPNKRKQAKTANMTLEPSFRGKQRQSDAQATYAQGSGNVFVSSSTRTPNRQPPLPQPQQFPQPRPEKTSPGPANSREKTPQSPSGLPRP